MTAIYNMRFIAYFSSWPTHMYYLGLPWFNVFVPSTNGVKVVAWTFSFKLISPSFSCKNLDTMESSEFNVSSDVVFWTTLTFIFKKFLQSHYLYRGDGCIKISKRESVIIWNRRMYLDNLFSCSCMFRMVCLHRQRCCDHGRVDQID